MKCVRCKVAPAVGNGCNICVPCFRKIVVRRYWTKEVKQAKKGAKK